MLRRGFREERREERAAGPAPAGGGIHRYQMREKLVSIGDDFWIENATGQRIYKVDGKALRLRNTLIFEDTQGNALCKIQERLLTVRDTMQIEGANGEQVAVVKKALIAPLRNRFTVKIKNGPDLEVRGNILDHEYTIGEGPAKVAEVSKRWFRIRDTYGVDIEPGQDDIVILAVTACIDQMVR